MKKYQRSGFTFLEVIMVVALTAGIGLWSYVNYSQQRPIRDLDSIRLQMSSLLRDASSRSASQSQGSAWGVRFEATSPTSSFFALFYGSYGTTTRSQVVPLPLTLRFDTSTFSGNTKEIIFEQRTGRVNASTSIRIYLAGRPTQSSTISVASSGLVVF